MYSKFKSVSLLGLIAVLLAGCNQNKSKDKEAIVLWLNSYKVSCQGVAPIQCFQIKTKDDEPWQNFYGNIEGFNFEFGYRYKLKVIKESLPLETLPQDESSERYQLVKVLNKTRDKTIAINDIWALTTISSKTNNNLETEKLSAFIEINLADRRISGRDDCGEFQGKLNLIGTNQIRFNNFTYITDRGNGLEGLNLVTLLKNVNSYEIKTLKLALKNNNVELLEFKKVD